MPNFGAAWRAATISSSFMPGSAERSRRIRSSEMPSVPQGTKCRIAFRSPYGAGLVVGLVGGGDHAVAVGRVADAAERHGEAALGVGAAPVLRGAPDPLELGLAEVTHAPYPGLVAGALDALHHLAHVAHRAAGEGEIRHVDHRLVAQFEGVQAGLPGPHLAAGLRAAHDGRGPGVGLGLVHEALDGAGPGLDVADGVAAGEHHAGDHAVGDGRLAAGGEDDGLVAAQREVAERVAAAVLGQQGAQLRLVLLGEPGGRVLGAERQVDRGDRGEQAERAERVARPSRRCCPGSRPGPRSRTGRTGRAQGVRPGSGRRPCGWGGR